MLQAIFTIKEMNIITVNGNIGIKEYTYILYSHTIHSI